MKALISRQGPMGPSAGWGTVKTTILEGKCSSQGIWGAAYASAVLFSSNFSIGQKLDGFLCRAWGGLPCQLGTRRLLQQGTQRACSGVQGLSSPVQVWSPSLGTSNSQTCRIWYRGINKPNKPPDLAVCFHFPPRNVSLLILLCVFGRYVHLHVRWLLVSIIHTA